MRFQLLNFKNLDFIAFAKIFNEINIDEVIYQTKTDKRKRIYKKQNEILLRKLNDEVKYMEDALKLTLFEKE
jgi:hypothetical protein